MLGSLDGHHCRLRFPWTPLPRPLSSRCVVTLPFLLVVHVSPTVITSPLHDSTATTQLLRVRSPEGTFRIEVEASTPGEEFAKKVSRFSVCLFHSVRRSRVLPRHWSCRARTCAVHRSDHLLLFAFSGTWRPTGPRHHPSVNNTHTFLDKAVESTTRRRAGDIGCFGR